MAKSQLVTLCLSLALGGALGYSSLSVATEAEPAARVVTQSGSPASPREITPPLLQEQEQVSINQATAEQLSAALNGVGLKKAQAIVNYREQYGPFSDIQQLGEVPGIGNALIERNAARLKL